MPPPVAVGDFPRDVPRDPTRFLWVHRLVSYKRPLEVAEAFRELPDLRLTMVGLGPLESRLRAALPANVELLGLAAARAAGRAASRAPPASSTWARRTSASRWSRRWPPGRPCWPPTAAAPATSCARARTACSSTTAPTRSRSAPAYASWPGGAGTPSALRQSAERFSEERFRERLGEVLRAHGAR